MAWLIFIATPFFMFFSLSAFCLPFICMQNRHMAIVQKRAIYEKGAVQLFTLSRFICFLFGVAFLLDYFLEGRIMEKIAKPLLLDMPFLILGIFFIAQGICLSIALKTKAKLAKMFYLLSCLLAMCLIFFMSIFTFSILRSLIIPENWQILDLFYTILVQNTHPFTFCYGFPLIFAVYLIFSIFLGFYSAHLISILYLISRRNSDDYGRDYYNTLLTSHATRALKPGLLLCIILPIIFYVTNLSHFDIISFVQFFVDDIAQIEISMRQNTTWFSYYNLYIFFTIGIAFIPLSILLLRPVALAKLKGSSPLQKKSYVFFSFLFLIFGLLFLLFRMVH